MIEHLRRSHAALPSWLRNAGAMIVARRGVIHTTGTAPKAREDAIDAALRAADAALAQHLPDGYPGLLLVVAFPDGASLATAGEHDLLTLAARELTAEGAKHESRTTGLRRRPTVTA